MLITNQSNEMMAKAGNISRLITYLNTVNAKNDFTNTVWYAIVPSVSLEQYSRMKLTRERFKGNTAAVKTDVSSVESLARLLDVFKDYAVQCFFCYETGDATTFNRLATEGIEKYEDRCASLMGKAYSEYAIPCIPNFTIIPKEKSGVILDRRMVMKEDESVELSGEAEDVMKLWIDGVYVGAAYVAAGLVAAYQSPEYLKEKFGRGVDPELPGVRFDIEADDHPLAVRTVMAKEITGFTARISASFFHRRMRFITG